MDLPFDSITSLELVSNIPAQTIQIWAYHFETEPFGLNLTLPVLPALPTLPAVPQSTLVGIMVLLLYVSITRPFTAYNPSTIQNFTIPSPSKLSTSAPAKISGLSLENITPITTQASEMQTKRIATISQHGGFDEVYKAAAQKYGVSWQILAAVHYVETGQSGDTDRASSAGAVGPMQFMPSTFDAYAQDGDGDGIASIYDVHDAIYTAAKKLAVGNAKVDVRGALYGYNHSSAYVDKVLSYAASLGYGL